MTPSESGAYQVTSRPIAQGRPRRVAHPYPKEGVCRTWMEGRMSATAPLLWIRRRSASDDMAACAL
jgi:hypothetical protein